MRANSPLYTKPLGAPDNNQETPSEIREEVVMHLANSLFDNLKEEAQKDPTITTWEVVEATNRFLAVQSIINRRLGVSKLEFMMSAVKRLSRVINNAWGIVVKIEARTGVAG